MRSIIALALAAFVASARAETLAVGYQCAQCSDATSPTPVTLSDTTCVQITTGCQGSAPAWGSLFTPTAPTTGGDLSVGIWSTNVCGPDTTTLIATLPIGNGNCGTINSSPTTGGASQFYGVIQFPSTSTATTTTAASATTAAASSTTTAASGTTTTAASGTTTTAAAATTTTAASGTTTAASGTTTTAASGTTTTAASGTTTTAAASTTTTAASATTTTAAASTTTTAAASTTTTRTAATGTTTTGSASTLAVSTLLVAALSVAYLL
eukprot:TRINITY_DN1580_c0_g1_i4.p1 TRINITY_DN1580_c0_g1~~TRINITY_DN1580_c0_g1_i4.p1  ORF type:complete len:268 (+),score=96.08 TRINITY_DN1580_c0_g1_i4:61-864(+)